MFALAEKIEVNGANFYRRASEMLKKNQKASKLLLELAAMEEEHRIVYAAMRAKLSEQEKENTIYDPEDQMKDYITAIADMTVFNKEKQSSLTGGESPKEVMRMAIESEKDSIIFYLGLKDLVPDTSVRSRIDSIIQEEKKHVVILANELRSL